MAEDGSPLKSLAILSISSNRNTGLIVFALFMPWIILPGIAPIYVRRCPLISASSRTPPNEILTKFLLIALEIDLAKDVFPTPGGPTRQIIGPLIELVSF